MEFIKTFLQAYYGFFNVVILIVVYWFMSHDLIGNGIVFFFNHLWIPLDCNMTFLQEIIDLRVVGLYQASTALLNPMTLWATVTLSIYHLQQKWPQPFGIALWIDHFRPVLILPPYVFFLQVLAILLEYIVSSCPNFFINSPPCRLIRQAQYNRRR